MSVEVQELQHQLQEAVKRIDGLENRVRGMEEASRWRHLVYRPSSWRKQLSFRERNMTVGQFASKFFANRHTPESVSEDLDLPLEAVHEALAYYEQNKTLIQAEAAEERQA